MERSLTDQESTFGFLNAAVTLCDNFPQLKNTNSLMTSSLNPLDFMINISISLGCYQELSLWLAKQMTYVLPALELAVKGLILSHLKNVMFCDVDPRIPDEYRMKITDNKYAEALSGIFFDASSLDVNNMLSVSPFTDYGKTLYFGTDKALTAFQLLRAEDLNAFLWLIYNKTSFSNPTQVGGLTDINENANGSFLDEIIVDSVPVPKGIVVGSIFQLTDSNVMNVCTSELITETVGAPTQLPNGKLASNTTRTSTYKIYPFSHNNTSANWYVNRDRYYDFLTPNKEHKERNYKEDIGLFNLSFVTDSANPNVGKLRFQVLPKPFLHLPRKGEPLWRVQRILFNGNGEPDQKGNFTVKAKVQDAQVGEEEITYNLDEGVQLIINVGSGDYKLSSTDKDTLPKILYQCYRGFTVYEFNYDFVMGIKLFDPKVICSTLVDSFVSLSLGLGAPKVTHTTVLGKERIAEVVRKILETDGTEVSDCSFTFSNAQEEAMLEKAEELKAGGYKFSGAFDRFIKVDEQAILNDLSSITDDATLEENTTTITHMFEQITASITDEVMGEERYGLQCSLIRTMIVNFAVSIVSSLITPKLLLLFYVNKQMMGLLGMEVNIEEFLQSIWNLITAIIKEVIEEILNSLLEFILSRLRPILECISNKLLLEQIEDYRRLLRLIIEACSFKGSSSNSSNQLDNVVGADIYDNTTSQPQSSGCDLN